MFQFTRSVVVAAFGAGRSDGALLAVPVIPAAALVEAGAAAVQAVGAGVSWLRRRLAAGLRSAAEVLDPAPVVLPTVEYRYVERPALPVAVPVEAPVLLPLPEPMPSAAQVTTERPAEAGDVDYAALLAEHGSYAAVGRAIGVNAAKARRLCLGAGARK